jgi:hypothetical protein
MVFYQVRKWWRLYILPVQGFAFSVSILQAAKSWFLHDFML